jgi:preprotein translocase subunit SecF
MKRFLIVFVAVVFLLVFFSFMMTWSNHFALAIDRTPKENNTKEKEEPVENPAEGGAESKEYENTEVKERKTEGNAVSEKETEKIEKNTIGEKKTKETVPEKVTKWLKSLEKQKAEEKYDYFIDKNNNGIDDRLEKKSKEPVSPPAVRPVPEEKQPKEVTPSTKESGEKKKTREAPKEKETKRQRK